MTHRPGSRKARVHAYFRTHGYEQTVGYGLTLGLAEHTIRTWMRAWRDEPLEEDQDGETPQQA